MDNRADERAGGGVVVLVVVVLALLVGGGWAAAYYRAGNTLAHGTSVSGIDVGGRTMGQAEELLRATLGPRTSLPISVTTGASTLAVRPDSAGLGIDYGATLDQASVQRSWRPGKLWQHYAGGQELSPVIILDGTRMAAAVARLGRKLGTPARDGAITLHGDRVAVTQPRTGHQLDPAETAVALESAFSTGSRQAEVVLHDVTPLIDDRDVQRGLDRIVNPALAGSVRLLFGDTPVRLQPARFSSALRLVARDGRLVARADGSWLRQLVDRPSSYDRAPVDATVELDHGRPSVVPARAGVSFSEPATARAFLTAVDRDLGRRSVHVAGRAVRPAVTTRDARRWRIDHVVARASAPTRSHGVRPAVEALDGAVLAPGRTLSLERVLGDAAAAPGVARLAAAVDGAAGRAGLEVTGEDAALRVRNTSRYGVLLHATLHDAGDRRTVRVRLWSHG